MQHKCLTIAGFDGSGGAGMQADLKTFSALGCYGLSVLTALPVQNTMGVQACYDISLACILQQLTSIFEDIVPDSIKIGMLFSADIIILISDFLKQYASSIPIVLDPVMVAKSGHALLQENAVTALKTQLLPLATIVTPNLLEAQALLNTDSLDQVQLAKELLAFGSQAVLVKGGHSHTDTANDFYLNRNGEQVWLQQEHIHSKNTHGTGCTLSAAIAACLALGMNLQDACQSAKHYLTQALYAVQNQFMGHGHGSVHHFYHVWPTLNKIEVK